MSSPITFEPLSRAHFPLLFKWLKTPHVKAWWDQDMQWTPTLIQEKYESYVRGYKIHNDTARPIKAYIIHADTAPVGYIQYYNAYDFPRAKPLIGLPDNLAAFDMFIGEEHYLCKNIGSRALTLFFTLIAQGTYTHVFADPDSANIGALKTYEKAGMQHIQVHQDIHEVWMMVGLSKSTEEGFAQNNNHSRNAD
jgi:aminoglycoside 6'-N-acetyltransferase